MINPSTEKLVLVVVACFSLSTLANLWVTIGLWGPILMAVVGVVTINWAIGIGKNMKELEYEQNRAKKKRY